MANNTIKYRRIDAQRRVSLQDKWNQPILWPLLLLVMLFVLLLMPAWLLYRQKLKQKNTLK